MISELANIGKTIDDLISGTVDFLYAIAMAIFLVYANPIRGAAKLHQTRSISSTTLLFLSCAAVMAYVSYGESAAKTLLNSSSPNLIVYIVVVIVLYIVADICVRVLSLWCALWGRRRIRAAEMLRYSLSGVLMGWVIVIPLIFYVDAQYISPRKIFADMFLILKYLPVICLVLAYPLFVTLFYVGRRRRGSGALGLIGVGALSVCTILIVMVTVQAPLGGFVSASLMEEKVDDESGPVVRGFSCQETADGNVLQIDAVVFNPTNTAIVLNSESMQAAIGPFETPGRDVSFFLFPYVGEPLITIAPRAAENVKVERVIDEFMRKVMSDYRGCFIGMLSPQDPSKMEEISKSVAKP